MSLSVSTSKNFLEVYKDFEIVSLNANFRLILPSATLLPISIRFKVTCFKFEFWRENQSFDFAEKPNFFRLTENSFQFRPTTPVHSVNFNKIVLSDRKKML